MRLLCKFQPAVWSLLILTSLASLSGCEEELPPIVDIDTPFSTLLTSGTDRELCEFTYYKICNQYNFHTRDGINVEVEKYSPEERMVILVWHTSDYIINGGFTMAYTARYVGDPDFEVTAKQFETLGLDEQMKILVEARNLAPEGKLPETPKERQAMLEGFGKAIVEPFDFRFREACSGGALEQKLAAYIRENAAALSHLDQKK